MDYSLDEDIFDKVVSKIKLLFVPFLDNNYSPKFLQSRVLFYFVIFVLVIKILFVSFSLNIPKNIFFADISKNELVEMINEDRNALGLKSLGQNSKLDQAALLKAKDMANNQYFAHTSPTGISPWFWFRNIGYDYKYAGENLAIGYTESVDVYNAWFNSDSHRENFLSQNYNEVGTGILTENFDGNNAVIVVQFFGKQKTEESNVAVNSTKTDIILENKVESVKPVAILTTSANMAIKVENEKTIEAPLPKVLSETVNLPDDVLVFREFNKDFKKSLYLEFVNIIFYSYQEILHKFVYWLFIFVSIISLMNILVNYKIQNRQLVLKSLVMVLLLYVSTYIDKQLIIGLLL